MGEKLNEGFNIYFLKVTLKRFFELNWCDVSDYLFNMIRENENDFRSIINLDLNDFKAENEKIIDPKSNQVIPLNKTIEESELKMKDDSLKPLSNETKKDDFEHLLQLVTRSKTINEEKQNFFLKHPTTKYLLHKKWSLMPRVF